MLLCSSWAVWNVNVSWWVDKWLNINHPCLPGIASWLSWLRLVYWLACFLDWQCPSWRNTMNFFSCLRESSTFQVHLLHFKPWKQSPLTNVFCFDLIHQASVWHPGLFQDGFYSHFWSEFPQANFSQNLTTLPTSFSLFYFLFQNIDYMYWYSTMLYTQ